MALQKAQRTSNAQGFKFTGKGDTLKGFYVSTTEETINGSKVKKHVFQTDTGAVSVLGQADMYNQLTQNDCLNSYVEITFTGDLQKLKGGKTMKLYDVAFDKTQSWDAGANTNYDDVDDSEENVLDEIEAPAATPPPRAAKAPSAANQAKVQALLSSAKNRS